MVTEYLSFIQVDWHFYIFKNIFSEKMCFPYNVLTFACYLVIHSLLLVIVCVFSLLELLKI